MCAQLNQPKHASVRLLRHRRQMNVPTAIENTLWVDKTTIIILLQREYVLNSIPHTVSDCINNALPNIMFF